MTATVAVMASMIASGVCAGRKSTIQLRQRHRQKSPDPDSGAKVRTIDVRTKDEDTRFLAAGHH
jgi:hypothetical protein